MSRVHRVHRLCHPVRDAAGAQASCDRHLPQLPRRHALARPQHIPRYGLRAWPAFSAPRRLARPFCGSPVTNSRLPLFLVGAASFDVGPSAGCSHAAVRTDSDLQ